MNKTIKDLVPKPSDAIYAMLQGLEDHKDNGMEIDMSVWSSQRENKNKERICYGCAATATLIHLLGITPSVRYEEIREIDKNFTPKSVHDDLTIRSIFYGIDHHQKEDLNAFELAIDEFRKGQLWKLFEYYNPFRNQHFYDEKLYDLVKEYSGEWYLSDKMSLDNIRLIEDFAYEVKKLGH